VWNGQFTYLDQGIIGLVISAIVGFLALKMLEKILIRAKFYYFGFYCLGAGYTAILF